jgi:hypothetical protein
LNCANVKNKFLKIQKKYLDIFQKKHTLKINYYHFFIQAPKHNNCQTLTLRNKKILKTFWYHIRFLIKEKKYYFQIFKNKNHNPKILAVQQYVTRILWHKNLKLEGPI